VPRVGKTKGAATKAPKPIARKATPSAKPSAKRAPAKRASARSAVAKAAIKAAMKAAAKTTAKTAAKTTAKTAVKRTPATPRKSAAPRRSATPRDAAVGTPPTQRQPATPRNTAVGTSATQRQPVTPRQREAQSPREAQKLRVPAASVPADALPVAGSVSPASSATPAASARDDDDDMPPGREEMLATRDIGRLLRYGEHIGSDKIDVRMLPLQLHAGSGALALCDPSAPASWRVFDRPIGNGAFRAMLSIARPDDGGRERLAAVVIHVGRPPIARWTVAHFRGEPRPTSAAALPRVATTSGWLTLLDAGAGAPGVVALPPATGVTPIEALLGDGRRALALPCGDGAFVAYWAVDATDKPVCIVIDFEAFTPKAWRAKPRAI
jgi:hypothetical protein